MKSVKQNNFTYAVVIWIVAVFVISATYIEQRDIAEAQPTETVETEDIVLVQKLIETKPETVENSRVPYAVHDMAMINISDEDRGLLALVVYHEARGEPFAGQVAVVEVVLNRLLSQRFPDTIYEVIYQKDPLQFACSPILKTSSISEPGCIAVALDAIDAVLYEGVSALEEPYLFFSTGKPKTNNYQQIGNHYFY